MVRFYQVHVGATRRTRMSKLDKLKMRVEIEKIKTIELQKRARLVINHARRVFLK